jgi:hypothetical protein
MAQMDGLSNRRALHSHGAANDHGQSNDAITMKRISPMFGILALTMPCWP